eukprot:Clim_evm129s157 gene=Clim_evmTU129s157
MDMQQKLPLILALVAVLAASAYFYLMQNSKPSAPKALDATKAKPFKLIEKKEVSPDTRIFRFALDSDKHILGLPIGQHMSLSATVDGKPVMRSYTPITSDDEVGYFDLMIKVYFSNVHPKFPNGGKMTQYLENMKVGDTIDVKGPKGKLTYEGRGKIDISSISKSEKRVGNKIGMIAGGSGITPMLQVVKAILKDPKDKTEVCLLYANQTEKDILLRDELEGLAASHDNFKVWYTLDRPEDGWKYDKGFITKDMIEKHLPAASPDTQILMCGPPPMIDFACLPNLKELGFGETNWYKF